MLIRFSLLTLGDFTDKTLEGKLSDEQVGTLLVTTDFTKSDGSYAEEGSST